MASMKTCKRCGAEKAHGAFHKLSASPDGLRRICKVCRSTARKRTRLAPSGHKFCALCKDAKELTEFYARSASSDGRRSWCIECEGLRKEAARQASCAERAVLHAAELARKIMEAEKIKSCGKKPCADCAVVQPLSAFWRSSSSLDGHAKRCKACASKLRHMPDPVDVERADRWARRKQSMQAELERRRTGGS